MTAKRTDGNQAEIARALREVGCQVADTHTIGGGYPDLTVLAPGGRIVLLEVKTAKGKLTEQERAFLAEWPVEIVHDIDEALRAVGVT